MTISLELKGKEVIVQNYKGKVYVNGKPVENQ